jgi:peptidoglycan hydrolase CwlO-like protein
MLLRLQNPVAAWRGTDWRTDMWAGIKASVTLIPYAAILVLLVALAIFRYQLQAAIADNAALSAANALLKDANEQQEKTINKLVSLRDEEHKILLELSDKVDTINSNVDETKTSIDELQQSSDDVKTYLSNRLPADLNRLLNR